MNICLYTMHREETIGEMVGITAPNKVEYCQRHGYGFHHETWTESMFPGFERLPVLIHLLKCHYYDWIFWLGADALITNLSKRIEDLVDPNFGIVMATDFTQVQMDSFLVQKKMNGLKLMEKVWGHRDSPIGQWYEQSTLDSLMNTSRFRGTVKLVPQRFMNAYRHKWFSEWFEINEKIKNHEDCLGTNGEWQPGDFVFHIPGRPLETKLRALREIVPLIQR